ncbi:excisionase family protein [Morganella sp. GD04133]|uniref:excisionase family protein n=1 Tax=Morganella sp. GD04133 TaxID=2975435 RepID=UPI0024488A6F|nr:excisionase family protein [Morganella sp. GD04133]MDH0356897.1 excisionase family protein [Morganella sp. GD04133]
MGNVIILQANKWVAEDILMLLTGLSKSAITSARKKSWFEGREYRHYSADCNPKDNSPIMYNRFAVDEWVERQNMAVPRGNKG